MQLPSVYAHQFQLRHFKLLIIVPWLEVDVGVLASFLDSDVLSFLFEVLGANMVGDVVCVLS